MWERLLVIVLEYWNNSEQIVLATYGDREPFGREFPVFEQRILRLWGGKYN